MIAGGQPLTLPATARTPTARWWVLGLSTAYGTTGAALVFTVAQPYVRWAVSVLVAVCLCAYTPLSRRLYRRPIVITAADRLLTLAHFGSARLDRPPPRGVWFDRYSGVALGTAIHVRTDNGRVVRVGGRGLHTPTELCTARATRSVDVTVATADLHRLLDALGMGRPEPVTVRVALFDRVNSGRSGCLRLGMPILVLYAVGLIGGGAAYLMQRWWRPGAEAAMVASFGLAGAVLVSVVATIWIGQTRRPTPAWTLEFEPGRCLLRDRQGGLVVAGPPRWRRLRFLYRDLGGRDRACPVVELAVSRRRPFTLGLMEPEHAWRGQVPTTSMPRYLVGPPDWPPLLAALRAFPEDRATRVGGPADADA